MRVKPRRTIARGFRTPLGLAWDGGRLFVSAQGTLWRIERGRRRALVSRLPFGRHQQDNVVVHRGRLYFGSGSTCDACAEKSRLSAAVLSVRPDGRDLRVVARGLRNPFGLAVDPRDRPAVRLGQRARRPRLRRAGGDGGRDPPGTPLRLAGLLAELRDASGWSARAAA